MILEVLRTRSHPQAGRATTWTTAFVTALALPGLAGTPSSSPWIESVLGACTGNGGRTELRDPAFGRLRGPRVLPATQ